MKEIDNSLDILDKLVKDSTLSDETREKILNARQEFYLFYYKIFMLEEMLKIYRYTRSITQAHDICEYLLDTLKLSEKPKIKIPVKDYYENQK